MEARMRLQPSTRAPRPAGPGPLSARSRGSCGGPVYGGLVSLLGWGLCLRWLLL